MKCDLLLLEDYIEGFLDTSEQMKVEDHLKCCKHCQSEYEQLVHEQKSLFTQLNTPILTNSQSNIIMKRIQKDSKRKNSWHTLKITIISAAVIMLSFTLYYWNRTPNEVAQPIDKPLQLVEANSNEQEEFLAGEQVLDYNEPFLDVSIEEVVENGEDIDIRFRVKFNDEYQYYNDSLYEQMLNRYEYDEYFNSPVDKMEDHFFGSVRTKVHFAIRNELGELIIGPVEGEQPFINSWSSSSGGTDILGEMIYTTSVPSYTKPATLEVLAMEATVFDFYETEVNSEQLQPFQFKNATYTIDALEIKQDTLHLQISTEGKPAVRPDGWNIVINNHLIVSDRTSINWGNNRTIFTLQFDGQQQIPSTFKLIPSTVTIKKEIEPIILDLN